MIRASESESTTSIELTPIIDMVFLLLIFFLVASSFQETEREMQIALPTAMASGPISTSMRELIINVDADGNVVVNGSTMVAEDLAPIIENALEINPEQKVSVRGDRRVAYESVVRVLDICKSAGITEPFLDTVIER
jgi:biopolymer transport protein ExbD